MFHTELALGDLLNHTWSLAVEEQFYVFWPLLLILLLLEKAVPNNNLACTRRAHSGEHVAPSTPVVEVPHLGPGGNKAYPRTDMRLDELAVGCALAVMIKCSLWLHPRVRRIAAAKALAAVAAATLVGLSLALAISGGAYYLGGLTLVILATAGLIAHVCSGGTSAILRGLAWRPLTWVGERSYGVYLFHPFVFIGLMPAIPGVPATGILSFGVGTGLTLIVAAVSFRFIERPFIRRKKYAATSKHTQTAADGSVASPA